MKSKVRIRSGRSSSWLMYRLPGLTVCTLLPGDGRLLRSWWLSELREAGPAGLASLGRWRGYPAVADQARWQRRRLPIVDGLGSGGRPVRVAGLWAGGADWVACATRARPRAGDYRAGDPAGLFLASPSQRAESRAFGVADDPGAGVGTAHAVSTLRRLACRHPGRGWRGQCTSPFATGSFAGIAPRRR